MYHVKIDSTAVVTGEEVGAKAIFRPVITTSRSPLYECDVNMHKSNSTYFTDLDLSTMHLLCRLFKAALDPTLRPKPQSPSNASSDTFGRIVWFLGGTSCQWLKEIKPYQRYEMHSRVLSWDQKWLYISTHFVPTRSTVKGKETTTVFASAMSKVVFKEGRKTVPPAVVFDLVGLCPSLKPSIMLSTAGVISSRARDAVEQERLRGLKLATHFAALDDLHAEHGSSKETTSLGKYGFFGRRI